MKNSIRMLGIDLVKLALVFPKLGAFIASRAVMRLGEALLNAHDRDGLPWRNIAPEYMVG
jgi:hypothetical protein